MTINAPSVACWSLMIAVAYLAIAYNYLFIILCFPLLLLGIHYYNKEGHKQLEKDRKDREEREAKERRDQEERERVEKSKADRQLWDNLWKTGRKFLDAFND